MQELLQDWAMKARKQRFLLNFPVLLFFSLALVAPRAAISGAPAKEEGSPGPTPSGAKPLMTFAAYGDIPYLIKLPDGRTDNEVLTTEIAPALRQRNDIPFIIHLGDLSRPENACSDEWLQQTNNFWKQKLVKPVFYTPGDNEWTDCDRKSLKAPQSEYARLNSVRNILFGAPKTVSPTWQLEQTQQILSQDPGFSRPEESLEAIRKVLAMGPKEFAEEWRYENQPQQPENAIWWRDGVLFVTVHKVSTDDGRSEILLDDPRKAIALVDQRDRLNQQWLNRAFALAKKQDAKAVVIATQLDPFDPGSESKNKTETEAKTEAKTVLSHCLANPAYAGFCRQIESLSAGFGKPVLLLHGDTNAYCLDKPFGSAQNIWRLNAPGDYKVIDAVVIKVAPDDAAQPFQATGLLSGKPAPAVCDYSF
jgi:hypothetical protein